MRVESHLVEGIMGSIVVIFVFHNRKERRDLWLICKLSLVYKGPAMLTFDLDLAALDS